MNSRPDTDGRTGRQRDDSTSTRIARYRQKALVANIIGVGGILLALYFVFKPVPILTDHTDDYLLALIVFVPAYCLVIYGCWWWIRAKGWPEAVVLIGLLPLVILGIPYVRLIYRFVPLLLPATMVIMPIMMIAVIAVLPDRSGISRRRRRRHRDQGESSRSARIS